MKRPPALIKLIDLLADLFDRQNWSREIVEKANIEDGMIPYDNASLINWRNIVNESLRQDALDRLVGAAAAEHVDAGPELQKLLGAVDEWLKRNQMSARQLADNNTNPPTFLEIILTRVLTNLERAFTILAALALVIGVAIWIYRFMPSNTSNFSIRGPKENDDSAFVAKIHNDGGRSAEFVDGSFALEFTGLPIQTHTNIILVDARNARRIPGHDDVHITLTTTTFFTPIAKPNGENCFPTEEEVKELLPHGKVVLTARVEESGHREKTVRTEPVAASLIQPFLLRAYPDDVPMLCH
ncbi:MAG: hypothetical protein DMF56_15920 [Acidobacteria bacterium]|nr:MAG: hypothetical protein DMF56_15920 [Acidobacteriota bacterium]